MIEPEAKPGHPCFDCCHRDRDFCGWPYLIDQAPHWLTEQPIDWGDAGRAIGCHGDPRNGDWDEDEAEDPADV